MKESFLAGVKCKIHPHVVSIIILTNFVFAITAHNKVK